MKKPQFFLRDFLWLVAVVAAFIAGGAGKLPLPFLPASPTVPKVFESLSQHDLEPFAGTRIAQALWEMEQEMEKNGTTFQLLRKENKRLRKYIAANDATLDPRAAAHIDSELEYARAAHREYEREALELGGILVKHGILGERIVGEREQNRRIHEIEERLKPIRRNRPRLIEPGNMFQY